MKELVIKEVERTWVAVPLKPRHVRHLTRENWDWTVFEVLRLRTNAAGLEGWGETMCYYTWGRVPDAQVARVIGHSPFEFLWDDALGAGLQMAIYDLAGKALGVPCYKLLGPKVREWCPDSWWTNDMTTEDWIDEMREALDLGYMSAKLKGRPWRDFVGQVEALAKIVPSDFRFDADFNAFLDRFRDRVIFPLADKNGQVVAVVIQGFFFRLQVIQHLEGKFLVTIPDII